MRSIRKFVACTFSILAVLSMFQNLYAQDSPARVSDIEKVNADISKEIHALQEKMRSLESRLASAETTGQYAPEAGSPSPFQGIRSSSENIQLSGYIDTSYTYNLNRPEKRGTSSGTNGLRAYDTRDNSFDLNAYEMDIEKPVLESGVGFRVDILYGLNALVNDGTGLNFATASGTVNELDIQQAYGHVRLPLGSPDSFLDKVDILAGKFVTLAGTEVLESQGNWNISRSMAWFSAEPLSHTGIRTTWDFLGGKMPIDLGINNGWDLVAETNDYKTLEAGMGLNFIDDLRFYTAHYLGKESQTDRLTAEISDDMRYLSTATLTWKTPLRRLTLMGGADFGNQRNMSSITNSHFQPKPYESAQWHAYALYAKYDLTDKFYFAYRGELFRDDDSFRTLALTDPVAARTFWGHTLTLDYRPYANWIVRLEYRADVADAGVYDRAGSGGSSQGQNSQDTFATEMIYLF